MAAVKPKPLKVTRITTVVSTDHDVTVVLTEDGILGIKSNYGDPTIDNCDYQLPLTVAKEIAEALF
jgi:hypothetical protein